MAQAPCRWYLTKVTYLTLLCRGRRFLKANTSIIIKVSLPYLRPSRSDHDRYLVSQHHPSLTSTPHPFADHVVNIESLTVSRRWLLLERRFDH